MAVFLEVFTSLVVELPIYISVNACVPGAAQVFFIKLQKIRSTHFFMFFSKKCVRKLGKEVAFKMREIFS